MKITKYIIIIISFLFLLSILRSCFFMNKKFYKDVTYVTNPHDVLVLVNKNNKLPSSFIPDNLVAINIMGSNEDYNKFEESVEFEWMKNNAHLYGFILRYPKGKENITG
ncbi:MAG TPA: M15 family metallopeptidase, partial [Mollicutes bacterium]|nr:M15 family metallopeptidase [Mollicutes bacterium]